MDAEEILANIFYMGVIMSGDKGSNQDEESLKRLYKELGHRGIVDDWESAYERTHR